MLSLIFHKTVTMFNDEEDLLICVVVKTRDVTHRRQTAAHTADGCSIWPGRTLQKREKYLFASFTDVRNLRLLLVSYQCCYSCVTDYFGCSYSNNWEGGIERRVQRETESDGESEGESETGVEGGGVARINHINNFSLIAPHI